MHKVAYGLDISDRSIELVGLVRSGNNWRLERSARTELAPGIIEYGAIRDPVRLGQSLNRLLTAALGAKRGPVEMGVSLPETQVYAKLFRLPASLDLKLARQAAIVEAQKTFPISIASSSHDAIVVHRDDKAQEIFIAAAEKRVLTEYRDVLTSARITPLFFDLESLALVRSLVGGIAKGVDLTVDIGAKETLISVVSDGHIKTSFSLNVAGNRLTSALQKRLKLTEEQAEVVKRHGGVSKRMQDARVLPILTASLDEIVNEIRRTVQFANRQFGSPPRHVILAGGTCLLPGVVDYIRFQLEGIDVRLGDPFYEISLERLPKAEEFSKSSILFATAVGLAWRAAGVRAVPALDLGKDPTEVGTDKSFADLTRRFGARLWSMVKRTKSLPKKTKKEAIEPVVAASEPSAVKPPEPTSRASESDTRISSIIDGALGESSADSADETDTQPVAAEEMAAPLPPQPAAKPMRILAAEPEPEPMPAAVVAPVAASTPTVTPSPVMTATAPAPEPAPEIAEEQEILPEDGMGVGDLLDQQMKTKADFQEATEGLDETHEETSGEGEHFTIQEIISGKHLERKPPEEGRRAEPSVAAEIEEPEDDDMVVTGTAVAEGEGEGEEEEERPSIWPLIIIILVLVIATGVGVFFFARKTGIDFKSLWPFGGAKTAVQSGLPTDLPGEGETPSGEQPGQVPSSVTVTATLGVIDRDGGAKPYLKSRVVETDVTVTNSFRATGESMGTAGKAKGRIIVTNDAGRAFSFVATTRFMSADGVLFRLVKQSSIAATGETVVDVAADVAGPTGDIGPTTFTIPGLDSTPWAGKVKGRTETAMTGGSAKQTVVMTDDLEKAKNVIFEKAKAEAEENLKAMLAEGEVMLPELVTSTETKMEAPESGTVTAEFGVTATYRFRALLVPGQAVRTLLRDQLPSVLPNGVLPGDYEVAEPQYAVEAYELKTDLAEIRAEAAISKL